MTLNTRGICTEKLCIMNKVEQQRRGGRNHPFDHKHIANRLFIYQRATENDQIPLLKTTGTNGVK